MASTIQQQGGLSDLTSAVTMLMPALLGSGTKKESSSSTNTIDPSLLNLINTMIQQTTVNANDPKVTENIVNDILTKASQAFLPTAGLAAASGLYNSSTLQLLGERSKAEATNTAAKATLDYKTGQQQIAAQLATQLANLTKTTNNSGSGKTGSIVPGGATGMIGGALLAKSLWNKKDSLLDFFGANGAADTGPTWEAQGLLGGFSADNFPIPPEWVSAPTEAFSASTNAVSGGSDIVDFFNNFIGSNTTDLVDAASEATSIWDDLLQLF